MALPPERITVKRRRDEDPIEALYIQPKKYRPSALWKLAANEDPPPAFANSRNAAKLAESSQPHASLIPKVPIVRTTSPHEDSSQPPPDVSSSAQPAIPRDDDAVPSPPIESNGNSKRAKKSVSEQRRFHLTKTSLPAVSSYLQPRTSAQRHRKNRRHELAVFVENTGKVLKAKPRRRLQAANRMGSLETCNETKKPLAASESSRRRPNATAAERKWRAENWTNSVLPNKQNEPGSKSESNVNAPSHLWDHESLELAEELHRIALEETNASKDALKHSVPQLKTKPKLPKPRRAVAQQTIEGPHREEIMVNDMASDEDDDYVFDTYVRSNAHSINVSDPSRRLPDPLEGIDHSNVGILVIEEGEEEDLWEALGDIDSDPDWNSEEEDENAEDYYGNDYPEDEVNSDDEFGRGAYDYRHGASDDEEWGDEDPDWSGSDKEDEPKIS